MKRLLPVLILLCIGAAVLPAIGQARGRTTKVELRHTALGSILVNGHGFTLYVFAADSRGHDRCVAIKGCRTVWPLLKKSHHTTAGRGVKRSLLGSIRLRSGARQVTYAGHPLYTYAGDSSPGETSYVGINQFGAAWYAIGSSGRVIK